MELDLYLDGRWYPCASVALLDPQNPSRKGRVRLQYEADYAVQHLGARDHRALTVRAPVNLGTKDLPHWPSFLIDLLPQGAARKRIERLAGSTPSATFAYDLASNARHARTRASSCRRWYRAATLSLNTPTS
jgi:serine/threonine-protein kinase HipA